jgi:hypothetical protein
MYKSVLLLNAVPMLQVNFGLAWFDQRQCGLYQGHGVLKCKAGPNSFSHRGMNV